MAITVQPNMPVLRAFAAHAMHQATLWQINKLSLQDAVNGLYRAASQHNLPNQYGWTEIEWIISTAFEELGVDPATILLPPEQRP